MPSTSQEQLQLGARNAACSMQMPQHLSDRHCLPGAPGSGTEPGMAVRCCHVGRGHAYWLPQLRAERPPQAHNLRIKWSGEPPACSAGILWREHGDTPTHGAARPQIWGPRPQGELACPHHRCCLRMLHPSCGRVVRLPRERPLRTHPSFALWVPTVTLPPPSVSFNVEGLGGTSIPAALATDRGRLGGQDCPISQ